MATVGGLHDSTSPSSQQNNSEIDALARFAIQEHNKKENALFELVRVVEAREQVVAGTLHHLTLEVIDAGKKKLYEAKVWVKPWLNFKELQEFKHVEDIPSFTPSDLGIKKGFSPVQRFGFGNFAPLLKKMAMAWDGNQCQHMIRLSKMLQTMRLQPSSRDLTRFLLMSFLRYFMQMLRLLKNLLGLICILRSEGGGERRNSRLRLTGIVKVIST
ncbi:unnamed protein product [Coffea canephora]|uniref:Cysteine proteinase inhibitor n=1 Tax=Coffea canephora TaxID=49390 RepID=A0A068UB87_COFCA|nr:unnamed protein product [Coffea canephora]